jgi:hypothetical protein
MIVSQPVWPSFSFGQGLPITVVLLFFLLYARRTYVIDW